MIKNIHSGKCSAITADTPFTTDRLLVGQFDTAECELKKGINSVLGRKFFSSKFNALVQPLEKIEGGLSQVEERVLLEVVSAAGGQKISVWVGQELTDSEVTSVVNSGHQNIKRLTAL